MFLLKQISSLEKVRGNSEMQYTELTHVKALRGERVSYQIAIRTNETFTFFVEIDSPLRPYVRMYGVEEAVMDCPTTMPVHELGYITKEPGMMPDILVPLAEGQYRRAKMQARAVWMEVDLPATLEAGSYPITCRFLRRKDIMTGNDEPYVYAERTMTVEVLPATAEEQSLIYTRWFYADCISNYHGVPIYSDAHFDLIEAYIREAVDVGINMILVPIHTPPLDTAIGTYRPCVQLVDIRKEGDTYHFDFEKLDRFVDICKRAGVKYYEMAHMFSQWGAKCAANIMVEENGKRDYMFGWHVEATDPRYVDFLKQYIAAVAAHLEQLGVAENTYYHISDEPMLHNIEAYRLAANIIRPLIGKSRTFDALSTYDFYEQGLVECPVTAIHHMKDFLPHNIPNQWTYYCCEPQTVFSNSLMAMPSCRTRILGFMLYKYDIKGFLHWGLNFYNCSLSLYPINPYLTTSSDGAHPSGDPFILYPAQNGAYPSLRAKVMREGIGDMNLCRTLERYIGREAVVRMIDEAAGGELTLERYPMEDSYILSLREKMLCEIEAHVK